MTAKLSAVLSIFVLLMPVTGAAQDAAATAPQPEVPPPLACLAKYYGIEPIFARSGNAWSARLPDGSVHPYDDGKRKTFEEQLAAPDLQDMFALQYRAGAIHPVTVVNQDPGRIRYDPLFFAVWGKSAAEVDLVDIRFMGQLLKVNRKVAPAFARIESRLQKALLERPQDRQYLQNLGGTFNWRKIAGTQRQSAHSFGVSVDINVKRSAYWRWQKPPRPIAWRNEIPQAIVDAFEAEGFIWGGRWYHYDTMHFEYRPELLDPACRPDAP